MFALLVGVVCYAYYHLLGQQIFMLQKVEVVSAFGNMKIWSRCYPTCNKQSQLGTQHCGVQVARLVLKRTL